MLDQVLDRLNNVRKGQDGYMAQCPAHDDSDPSLALQEGDDQPVVLHCFAGCSPEEIIRALGLDWGAVCEDVSDLSGEVKAKESRAPKPPLPEYSDDEWKERCRAWKAMTPLEVELYVAYRKRRTWAREDRNREAFDRWQRKMDDLFDHVLQRETGGHRHAQRLDANTTHLER